MAMDVSELHQMVLGIQKLIDANDRRYGADSEASKQAVKDALVAQEKAVNAALAAADKAVTAAEVNAEKWRGQANEWRGAMNDRERDLMPRLEAQQRFTSIEEKIDALRGSSGAGRRELFGWVVAGAAVIFAVLDRVPPLR